GGTSGNIVPGNASFRIDMRARENETMEKLTDGVKKAIDSVTALYGATITTTITAQMAAEQTDMHAESILQQAIKEVTGEKVNARAIVNPGCAYFHFYPSMKPDFRIKKLEIGCGVSPGLHDPEMTINFKRLPVAGEIITRTLLLTLHQTQGAVK